MQYILFWEDTQKIFHIYDRFPLSAGASQWLSADELG